MMSFDWSCDKCGKPIGDKDSVITRTGRKLCYWCADLEKYKWDRYYDDDMRIFKDSREEDVFGW